MSLHSGPWTCPRCREWVPAFTEHDSATCITLKDRLVRIEQSLIRVEGALGRLQPSAPPAARFPIGPPPEESSIDILDSGRLTRSAAIAIARGWLRDKIQTERFYLPESVVVVWKDGDDWVHQTRVFSNGSIPPEDLEESVRIHAPASTSPRKPEGAS